MVIYTRLSVICFGEFRIGMSKDVSEIQDPSLVALAFSLPRVVLNAKAQNATVRYTVLMGGSDGRPSASLKLVLLFTFLLSLFRCVISATSEEFSQDIFT